MNKNELKGKWKQVKGEAQRQWGKLTDDDIDRAEGDSTKLAGIIQEKYGYSEEESRRQVDEWTARQA